MAISSSRLQKSQASRRKLEGTIRRKLGRGPFAEIWGTVPSIQKVGGDASPGSHRVVAPMPSSHFVACYQYFHL